jgi:hypothetical protein
MSKEKTNFDGFTFNNWKHTVDLFIFETIGMGMDDLPDACHYDAWQDDCPPKEWAEELLDENFGDAWRR